MKIIARLCFLSFVISSVCGYGLSGYAGDAIEVTSGSAIKITAFDAGLKSFKNKPLVFLHYKEGVSGYNGLTVMTPASLFQGEGAPEILCQIPNKTPAGAAEIWLTPLDRIGFLKPIPIYDDVMVKGPEITDVLRCAGPEDKDIYFLKGRFFGVNPGISVFFCSGRRHPIHSVLPCTPIVLPRRPRTAQCRLHGPVRRQQPIESNARGSASPLTRIYGWN